MDQPSALRARIRTLRLPPSYWDKIWAAWCPTCQQEAMPLRTGCCGFCDTNLTEQPTRGPHDPPLAGPPGRERVTDQTHNIAVAA